MKRFLRDIAIFISLIFTIIIGIAFYTYEPLINFVSNSVSNNAKARFIANHIDEADQAQIAIIGSSMSLNNIDARGLENMSNRRTFNFASWGMKIDNFQSHETLKKKQLIIMNVFFTDIGRPYVVPEAGFPYTNSKLTEFYNILSNFNTYKNQTEEIKQYVGENANRDYSCLNFDPGGSVVLDSMNFNKNQKRWDDDVFKTLEITEEKMDDFVERLKVFKSKFSDVDMMLFFSPPRLKFKSQERFLMIEKMAARIQKECPNTYFHNLYQLDYQDFYYLDNCHFNKIGAWRYTDNIYRLIQNYYLTK